MQGTERSWSCPPTHPLREGHREAILVFRQPLVVKWAQRRPHTLSTDPWRLIPPYVVPAAVRPLDGLQLIQLGGGLPPPRDPPRFLQVTPRGQAIINSRLRLRPRRRIKPYENTLYFQAERWYTSGSNYLF